MSYMNMAPKNSVDSKLMEYHCCKNNMDKETIKENFVNSSMLMYKAKKTARETNLYLKKLNNDILPKCRSTDVISDIANCRNIDVPSKITSESQYIIKKQFDENTINTDEKTKSIKLNSKSHVEKSVNNTHEIKNPQEISCTPKYTKSVEENLMNNVGIVNIEYVNNICDEKEDNCYKLKNLTVQKIPSVDLKPDLVTQKLANIQIKPIDTKSICSLMSNIAYSTFTFESESQIRACQPTIQPEIIRNKKVACYEIRKIICDMLKNKSSNDLLNDELTNKLETILINLEETNNYSIQLENLVEELSKVNLNENIIKNKILEIADNVFENNNDELSFDQMSVEIEKNSQQLLQRLAKIKNSILMTTNPSIKFSNDNNQQVHDVVNDIDENHTIQHHNYNFNSRNSRDNEAKNTNSFVSIKEYLNQGSNYSVCSKMFENVSVVKESASNIKNTQNAVNDSYIRHQQKKYQFESKNKDLSQATALEEEHKNSDKEYQKNQQKK